MKHLILASGSPRRKMLLNTIGFHIEQVCPANIVEQRREGESPLEYCTRLALEKSQANVFPHAVVLAADTIVCKEDMVYEKPRNDDEALTVLMKLSNTWHDVITAWALHTPSLQKQGYSISRVRFRQLTHAQCRAYVQTGEGKDKAGGYGIQGKGAALISEIKGSYSNIVGLPLEQLIPALKEFNITAERI